MHDFLTEVLLHSMEDRQARLRKRPMPHLANRSGTPSRARRLTGEALIRLGERLRGELGDLRETGATPAHAKAAAS